MSRNRVHKGFFISLGIGGILFLGLTMKTSNSAIFQAQHTHSIINNQANSATRLRPDHINYAFLFGKINILKNKGMPDGKIKSMMQRELGLRDDQAAILNQIAYASVAEARAIDAKARAIIAEERAKYPGGILPKDQMLPPVPPSLLRLQEERNAVFIKAQSSLQQIYGTDFALFNERIKQRYNPNTQAQVK